MSDLKITFSEAVSKGFYRGTLDSFDSAAELVKKMESPPLIVADHTEAPKTMGGLG